VAYLSFLLGIIAFLGLPAFLVSLEAIRDEWDNSLGSILHNFSPRVLIILVNGDGGGGSMSYPKQLFSHTLLN
jgi:hypothetical protein